MSIKKCLKQRLVKNNLGSYCFCNTQYICHYIHYIKYSILYDIEPRFIFIIDVRKNKTGLVCCLNDFLWRLNLITYS